jgi:hypothetical protein
VAATTAPASYMLRGRRSGDGEVEAEAAAGGRGSGGGGSGGWHGGRRLGTRGRAGAAAGASAWPPFCLLASTTKGRRFCWPPLGFLWFDQDGLGF